MAIDGTVRNATRNFASTQLKMVSFHEAHSRPYRDDRGAAGLAARTAALAGKRLAQISPSQTRVTRIIAFD